MTKERWEQWTEKELSYLRQRYTKEGPSEVASKLGRTVYAVVGKARRLGLEATRKLPPKNFKWTDEMLTAIRNRYVSEGAFKLASDLNLAVDTIRQKASAMGLHTIAGHKARGERTAASNPSYDLQYFDKWKPNMAYVLGFLFADGSVSKYIVAVNLKKTDVSVLRFIRKELKMKGVISYTEGYGNDNPQAHLDICSKVIVSRLVELGLHPRKTFRDDPFPNVPDDMMPHFVRGYFDGDGGRLLHADHAMFHSSDPLASY